jgi:hypothetical protein
MNFKSLAETLIGVILIGFFSSAVAVRLTGAYVSPADLRRE